MYHGMGMDNDDRLHMVAQEMLSLTSLHCTEHRGKPMPSSQTSSIASTMVDVNDELLLEQLAWAVYDGVLEPGDLPPLMGQHDWLQIMAGAYHLIYRGGGSKDHCPSCTMSSFSAVQTSRCARGRRGVPPPQRPMLQPPAPQMPAVWSAVSVAPRATSSYSAEGAMAVALDHVEEEISFHEFLAHHVQGQRVSWQAGGSSQPVTPSPVMELELADVTWRTTRWLKDCESECGDEKLVWQPLVCPLTDGSDDAMIGLTSHLLAAWKWTLAAYEVPTCPPTPTMLNSGQFLDEALVGWWLE